MYIHTYIHTYILARARFAHRVKHVRVDRMFLVTTYMIGLLNILFMAEWPNG